MEFWLSNISVQSVWIGTTGVLKLFLILQGVIVILAMFPALRERLGRMHWLLSLLIGPPLSWCAFESTGWMLFLGFNYNHVHGAFIFEGLSHYIVLIVVTMALQALLFVQFKRYLKSSLPVCGYCFTVATVICDALLFLYCVEFTSKMGSGF